MSSCWNSYDFAIKYIYQAIHLPMMKKHLKILSLLTIVMLKTWISPHIVFFSIKKRQFISLNVYYGNLILLLTLVMGYLIIFTNATFPSLPSVPSQRNNWTVLDFITYQIISNWKEWKKIGDYGWLCVAT